MKDCNGREIVAGDVVVSAQRRGSSCWLNTCDVLRVDSEKGPVLKVRRSPIIGAYGTVVYNRPYYHKSGSDTIAVIVPVVVG